MKEKNDIDSKQTDSGKQNKKLHKKEVIDRVKRIKKLALKEEIRLLREERAACEAAFRVSDEYRIKQLSKHQKFEKGKWYKLDNAGLIFPAMYHKGFNPNFTLTAVLDQKVDPVVLQQAVNDVAPRFAPITAALKRGVFWYYLGIPKPITVQRASGFHNYKSVIDGKTSMTRIFYSEHEISLSVFHTASDANGSLVLLNSLLFRYLQLMGHEIKDRTNRFNHLDKIQPEEVEDAYQKIADNNKLPKDDEKATYQIKGSRLPSDTLKLVKGCCSASKANAIAKANGATLTQLLNAALLYAVQQERAFHADKSKLPITVCSAVNLRKFFPTQSLRNFASYVSTTPQDQTTLQGLIAIVKQQYQEKLKPEYFQGRVNFNVRSQKNFFVKILPLPLKNFILGIGYTIMGKKARTMTLSNVGKVATPKEFPEHILRYEFHLGDPSPANIACACGSFNDILCITFTKIIEESIVEREFFRALSGLGIEFVIESNLE